MKQSVDSATKTTATPADLQAGDYYLLGQAIFGAMGVTQGMGHGSPAGLYDYIPDDPDQPWQFRLVLDYLTMGRDSEHRERFEQFWLESGFGAIIARKVTAENPPGQYT